MPETDTEAAPAAPATDAAQPPAQPAPQPTPSATDGTDWQAEAEKWKRHSRTNEDRAKGNHEELTRQGDVLKLVAEKLGLELDGKPDPAKLQAALESSQQQHRSTAAELAVYRAASASGADADALLDSRAFMASIDGLDPSAADYRQQVADAAKAFAEANPRYQREEAEPQPKRPPVARPSADFGAQPRSKQWTAADVQRASDAELDAAMKAGLLTEYGVGATKPSRYGPRRS